MKKLRVFISSVQVEFAEERKELARYLRQDPLLGSFFEPFLFEEVPATTYSPGKVYLGEVKDSDIYLGLMGESYGYEDAEGISPTEREYDQAKKEQLPRWIFIKEEKGMVRYAKEMAFIRKIEQDVSRKKFSSLENLKEEVYRSCILYLKQVGKIETHDFDDSLHPTAGFDAVDEEKVREFVSVARKKRGFPLKDTASVEQVLQHLRMTREGKLVNSALLAFAPDPQLYFPSSTIKCAHFHGLHVQKPIPDYKEYGGTVFEVADQAVNFVLSKLSLSTGTRDQSNRVETIYEIPRAVIAEAIINAVAHRDYYSKGSIQVSVLKDRVEISNPGTLPPELEISDLKVPHSSYPHNPLLAGCLFLSGDIERFGTGTLEMYRLSKEVGLKTPHISLEEGFKLTVWRPSADTLHDTPHVTLHDTTKTYREIAELSHRLVVVLQKEMSRAELMEILELKDRSHFVKSYLDPALAEVLIEMTLGEKAKSQHQKYRLTNKGSALKDWLLNAVTGEVSGEATLQVSGEAAGEVSGEAAGGVSPLVNEEIQKVIVALVGEMKRSEIQQKLELKHDDHFRTQYILPALSLGYIEMTFPDSPNHPNQKYRLTTRGRILKQQLEKLN